MLIDLSGQRVLVVGGSSGIGLAAAQLAAEAGATVTIAARSAQGLAAAKAETPALHTATVDALSDDDVARFFDEGGEYDHIAVTVGRLDHGLVRELPMEQAYANMSSKFWSAYRVARNMKLAQRGSLTFVSGVLSVRPVASRSLIAAINSGLDGLAKGLALEFSPIRVNAVSPGLVDTPLWASMDPAKRQAMLDSASTGLPAKTYGRPRDLGLQIVAIMANPFITGTVVYVDGGRAIS